MLRFTGRLESINAFASRMPRSLRDSWPAVRSVLLNRYFSRGLLDTAAPAEPLEEPGDGCATVAAEADRGARADASRSAVPAVWRGQKRSAARKQPTPSPSQNNNRQRFIRLERIIGP